MSLCAENNIYRNICWLPILALKIFPFVCCFFMKHSHIAQSRDNNTFTLESSLYRKALIKDTIDVMRVIIRKNRATYVCVS